MLRIFKKMSQFRNLVGSLGLMGVLSLPFNVNGQDTDSSLTHAQVRKQLFDVASPVSYSSWGEVSRYPGAAIVLFNSSCNATSEAEQDDMNIERAYAPIATISRDLRVNNQPIKFLVYDICGSSRADVVANVRGGPFIIMYLAGREIDRIGGSPREEDIPEWIQFLSEEWIPTNLTSPNGKYVWRFNGTHTEQRVAVQP
jgi:hypothetical protein